MKKENIPNALTLIRVVMIPIFIAILSLSHSYSRTYCSSSYFCNCKYYRLFGWLSCTKMECS